MTSPKAKEVPTASAAPKNAIGIEKEPMAYEKISSES